MVAGARTSKPKTMKRPPPSSRDAGDWTTAQSTGCPTRPPLHIPFAHYALIYVDDMGELNVAVSPSAQQGSGAVFTQDVQQRFVESIGAQNGLQNPIRQNTVNSADGVGYGDATQGHAAAESAPSPGKRRRMTPIHEFPSPPMQNKIGLRIGDADRIHAFYWDAFTRFQQNNCRTLAKEWIKFIEPKKQVRYPYKGDRETGDSDLTKPPWWPTAVQHKEPDHIKTDERVTLLIHMLCNLVKKNGTAKNLKEIADSNKRRLAALKVGVLDEIFKVRMLQERFERGEVDPATMVYVSQDSSSKPPADADFEDPQLKVEPAEPEEVPALPVHSTSMPAPSCSFESGLCMPFGSFESGRQPSHTASFYSSSPDFTDSNSVGSIIPSTPATSAMSSPHEQAPAPCDYLTQAPFFASSPEDQFRASHRHASVSVHPQPGQVDAWMPSFRHNIFSPVDYGTGQAVMPIPPAPPMPDPVHAPPNGLPNMQRPQAEMSDSRTMNTFRTGSLGHPNNFPPHN